MVLSSKINMKHYVEAIYLKRIEERHPNDQNHLIWTHRR